MKRRTVLTTLSKSAVSIGLPINVITAGSVVIEDVRVPVSDIEKKWRFVLDYTSDLCDPVPFDKRNQLASILEYYETICLKAFSDYYFSRRVAMLLVPEARVKQGLVEYYISDEYVCVKNISPYMLTQSDSRIIDSYKIVNGDAYITK